MLTKITELPSMYDDLQDKSVATILDEINLESLSVAWTVRRALPMITRLTQCVVNHLRQGGRLFYCGCGTGGRLAVLDSIETYNTYGIEKGRVDAIFPLGINNITSPHEMEEDNTENAWQQLQAKNVSAKDIVIGISASGTTPFVLAALQQCRRNGIATGCIVANPGTPIAAEADFKVVVITGPEYVTGSTRMKAGTAQKMVLDMISTTTMIRLGRVKGNRMTNARLLNKKLINRSVRTFMAFHPDCGSYDEVKKALLKYGSISEAEKDWLPLIKNKQ